MFREVEHFNKEIIGIDRVISPIEDDEEFNWMIGVVLEELDEFKTAHKNHDFVNAIDAVVDLLYFVSGFMTRMGIPAEVSEKIFQAVHNANMEKKKGKKDTRLFTHDNDAVKPEGWESPEAAIIRILEEYANESSS